MVLSQKSRIFFREFRRNFHTTGAILPSGSSLAREMTQCLVPRPRQPLRLLEVGPGTGPFTEWIAQRMIPGDTLDAVEINETFASVLQRRVREERVFEPVRGQITILEKNVLDHRPEIPYDAAFCGLPFNNFEPGEIERLFDAMMGMIKIGATLSYFEYWAIRELKKWCAAGHSRQKLQGIGQITGQIRKRYGARTRFVLANIPPALVHHLTKSA